MWAFGIVFMPTFSAVVVAPIKEENFDKDHQLFRRERRKEWKKGI